MIKEKTKEKIEEKIEETKKEKAMIKNHVNRRSHSRVQKHSLTNLIKKQRLYLVYLKPYPCNASTAFPKTSERANQPSTS